MSVDSKGVIRISASDIGRLCKIRPGSVSAVGHLALWPQVALTKGCQQPVNFSIYLCKVNVIRDIHAEALAVLFQPSLSLGSLNAPVDCDGSYLEDGSEV